MTQSTDVGAYVWPAYHDEPRARLFWPGGMGEWESVRDARPLFEGHQQPRVPLWGYLNEADPHVMEMKIDVAAEHGVNVFIYDWYWYDRRPFLEAALNDGYLQARNNDKVRFYLMWANHDAMTLWDKRNSHDPQVVWLGSQDRAEFERLGRRLVERYFGHPSYYRIDGRPVFCLYEPNVLIRGLGGLDAAADALGWLSDQADRAGLGGLHLQLIARGGLSTEATGIPGDGAAVQAEVVQRVGFDSVTHYQWVHFSGEEDFDAFAKAGMATWAKHETQLNRPVFPHVTIGWDNSPRFTGRPRLLVRGESPQKFRGHLQAAGRFLDQRPDQHRLVTVNSWNEWTEASYLEPDTRHGLAYLQAVRDVFARP
jgi:hypothetical protein